MINYSDLIGKEFKFFGRGPEFYDCFGLVWECSKRAGIILPEYKTFINLNLRSTAIQLASQAVFTKLEKAEDNCIVTFRLHRDLITHIGFCLDNKSFIHIMRKRRAAVEKLNNIVWEKNIDGFWRYNGTK